MSILAPLAATLMQLAISRKREFLADASGALLTRYPEGLARALEKISQDPTPLRVANNSTAHLWFENPFRTEGKTPFLHKLFMTHPPVAERIQALRSLNI
jgi:heat shock protein HtpX